MLMAQLVTTVRRLLLRDEGQDLIEYGLLAALIALVAIAGVTTLGSTISNVFWTQVGQAI
jgi:Flp pilus assembly pilin Flp